MLIINTRADLDALKGTKDYLPALRAIAGTLDTTINTATASFGEEPPEPKWVTLETLETITKLGFSSRSEFETEYAVATAEAELLDA